MAIHSNRDGMTYVPVSRDCPVYGIVGSMTVVLAVVLIAELEVRIVSLLLGVVVMLLVPLLTMMYAEIEPLAPVE